MNKKYIKFDLEKSPCGWWLRLANIFYNSYAGYVDGYGYISNSNANYNYGVLPACFEI